MNRPLKLVFDTSVLLAAVIKPEGYCAKYIWEAGLRNRFALYISFEIIAELRGKIATKAPQRLVYANQLIEYIQAIASFVSAPERINKLADEPDNRILECAEACQADLIVSFDKHLLELKKYGHAAIIHPSLLQDYFPH